MKKLNDHELAVVRITALNTDLKLFKVTDVKVCCWNHPRNLYIEEVDSSKTNAGQRNLTIERRARRSYRMFTRNREMQRNMRNDQDLTCNTTDQDQETLTTSKNKPYQCPLMGCNRIYKTVG